MKFGGLYTIEEPKGVGQPFKKIPCFRTYETGYKNLVCGSVVCLIKASPREYGVRYFFFHIETNCNYDMSDTFLTLKPIG